MSDGPPAAVMVLAAGEGTRMRSRLPKVLHGLAGRSMLDHVLAAVEPLSAARTAVVVGAGRELVAASLSANDERGAHPGIRPVIQERQLGTGHAVRVALEALDADPDVEALGDSAAILVLPGDAPLLRAETLADLLARHTEYHAAATLLTAVLDNPTGYGRVVREGGGSGPVSKVVEERDADPVTREIQEVATGVYVFAAGHLRTALAQLATDNAQGEQYLPDVVAFLVHAGEAVQAVIAADASETAGVNDRVQLAAAGQVLNRRLLESAMRSGVTVTDPGSTWLGAEVTLEPDVTLLPGVRLAGRTHVCTGARIGPDCTLTDTEVGEDAVVRCTTADGTIIGAKCEVGPYTYLRPGTRLGDGAKAGAYVEMKAATIGAGTKVPHLTYVGDADIGPGSNVGCGVVFVNYDGVSKSRTVVGEAAFVGSNSLLVAPVRIGDGAYTAAGSVITDDVPAGALGVGRARQRVIEDWTERRRAGTRSAQAAAAARQAKE